MKKMSKRIIAGTLTGLMIVSMSGCSGKDEAVEEAFIKAATEMDKVPEMEAEAEEAELPVSLTIEQESFHVAFYLEEGESRKLATNTDYNGELEYESSDDTVATVDDKGNVTAVKNGTATMTVHAGNAKRTVNVIVRTLAAENTEEPEEDNSEDAEQVADNRSGNTSSGTVGTAQTSGTNTAANTSGGGTASNAAASGGGTSNPETPSAPVTEEPAFNPEDYYLDWYYIQDQVNARLKADYPNCTIGASTWYESDIRSDGYEGQRWDNESMINNLYSAIKSCMTDVDSTYPGSMGMFINSITENPDGSRSISYTLYH